MNNKILVTYASRSGSTAEVAQAVTKTLCEQGAILDVLPVQDVRELSAYQAVVIGSPIRNRQWLPEAMQFIHDHRAELIHKQFATFTLSITLAMSNSERYRQAVSAWIAPVRSRVQPLSEGLFPGRLDFSKLPFNFDTLKLRLTVALGIFPKDDRRDWHAIHAWADSIYPLLQG